MEPIRTTEGMVGRCLHPARAAFRRFRDALDALGGPCRLHGDRSHPAWHLRNKIGSYDAGRPTTRDNCFNGRDIRFHFVIWPGFVSVQSRNLACFLGAVPAIPSLVSGAPEHSLIDSETLSRNGHYLFGGRREWFFADPRS